MSIKGKSSGRGSNHLDHRCGLSEKLTCPGDDCMSTSYLTRTLLSER